MARIKCQTCTADITESPRAEITFYGLATKRLDGLSFFVCTKHLSLNGWAERDIPLPPRISDPEAEPIPVGDCEAA